MTDQPPDQPPRRPSEHPAGNSPPAPTKNPWHQATSTRGGRWAIAAAAGALACLMLLGIGLAGLLVLRNHDRLNLLGQGQSRFLGRGPGSGERFPPVAPLEPGMPGPRDGRGPGLGGSLGGLGRLLGAAALHGNVTATIDGSVQTLVFQRGEITAFSATSITLKSTDGFVGTYGRNAATRSVMAAPVTGGQAFVTARASDKVATTIMAASAALGATPNS